MTRFMKPAAIVLLFCLALMLGSDAHGEDPAGKQAQHVPAFTKSREAAALVFVEQHRPQVLELLKVVREKNRAEYEKAIGRFFEWSEKVANAGGEDHGSVSMALQAWQAQIESQILGAQMLRHPDRAEELKQQLQKIVEQTIQLQIAQVDQQIAQMETQIETLRNRRKMLEEKREELVKQHMQAVEQLVAKHREGSSLQAEFEPVIRKIQEAAAKRQQDGGDISEIAELMQNFGPLVRDGKIDEARALLKKASELLEQ